MPTLARGQASDCDNPELDIFTKVNGVLTDVSSLEFTISEDVTTPGTPIQVYPLSGRATVDLALCPTGQKLSTGRYVAEWTPDLTEILGNHVIDWFFKLTPSSPEQTFCEEFTVLAEITGSTSTGYCTVADIRAEGITTAQASDARLQTLISRASRMIEYFTGRWFEPRSKVYLLDGNGSRGLLLGPPIIDVTQVRLVGEDTSSAVLAVDLGDLRIYNRHLTQELLDPDDRDNPRLEFLVFDERDEVFPLTGRLDQVFHPTRWPEGTQNVEVTGVFGYTDPDGSPYGQTPELIARACCLMVIRDIPLANDPDARDDARRRGAVKRFKTRDQEIEYFDPKSLGRAAVGMFTGDPEIDQLLAGFVRPPHLGAT